MFRPGAIAAAAAAAASVMLGAHGAQAFCRSTTCDTPDSFAQCAGVPEGCEPLLWRRPCIGWNLHESASKTVPYDITEAALEQAFAAWQGAACAPGIEIQNLGAVGCEKVEYNSLAGNANVVVFRDDAWPHEGADHNIALTTVTFDVKTGEIYDADIEVNSGQFALTWDDVTVNYDFVSILTHEAGHFLGLSHSEDTEATMYRHYDVGTIAFRDLSPDDEEAICTAYPPPDTVPLECNPIPRHGFSPECAASQKEGSCSAAGAGAGSEEDGPLAAFAPTMGLFALLALSRSLRRNARKR